MPKLSQQTLEKRFLCPHCGQTLRTRQGLSGHIQFKHQTGSGSQDKSLGDWVADVKIYEVILRTAGFSEAESKELTQVVADWAFIKPMLETRHMAINSADEKTYLIARFAQRQANQRLLDTLRKELDTVISELMKNQTEITESIYKKLSQ